MPSSAIATVAPAKRMARPAVGGIRLTRGDQAAEVAVDVRAPRARAGLEPLICHWGCAIYSLVDCADPEAVMWASDPNPGRSIKRSRKPNDVSRRGSAPTTRTPAITCNGASFVIAYDHELHLEQLESPIIAAQVVPGRELEVESLEQREAELAADRIRGCVLDGRKRMEEPVFAFGPRGLDHQPGAGGREATPLEPRQHHPAGLIDRPAAPLLLPVADRADCLAGRGWDDLEHPASAGLGELLVPALPVRELLPAFRAAEMRGHRRIAEKLLQKFEVAGGPRLDSDAACNMFVAHLARASRVHRRQRTDRVRAVWPLSCRGNPLRRRSPRVPRHRWPTRSTSMPPRRVVALVDERYGDEPDLLLDVLPP